MKFGSTIDVCTIHIEVHDTMNHDLFGNGQLTLLNQ